MFGIMQDRPLLIADFLKYAARYHPDTEIVSRLEDGTIHRYGYSAADIRARQLSSALTAAGVKPGDRVATLAMNTYRHFELYFGVSGMGAILHTVNPKLFDAQITYIIEHGGASIVFIDPAFLEMFSRISPDLYTVEKVVVLSGKLPSLSVDPKFSFVSYEEFLKTGSPSYSFPELDERTASLLCYTSGTTGDPKGVLYSHRSAVLHAMAAAQNSSLALSVQDVLFAVAPMFHATAWSIPYLAPMLGAKLLLPGPKTDGESLHSLAESEGATFAVGVPTIFTMLLEHLKTSGKRVRTLKHVAIGGSAVPPAMIDLFREQYDCKVTHIWGMTELSPLGTAASLTRDVAALPEAERRNMLAKQGRIQFGVEVKLVTEDGSEAPHDGSTSGALWVRGPWVASGYFRIDEAVLDSDGWFPTQDVATIDPFGYLKITDRAKDVIKSGGEWISSVEVENIASGYPGIRHASVVGVRHPKWEERPLLIVVPEGGPLSKEDILGYLSARMAKWWLPDDVVFVEHMPLTATGKIKKSELRKQFEGHLSSAPSGLSANQLAPTTGPAR